MAQPLRGLVLAAGTGSRLMPLTEHRPKALVAVGVKSILERLLAVCAGVGLREVVVVTGHGRAAVDDWLGAHATPLPVRTVYNPAYATLNNAQSVWAARDALGSDGFVQFDGDLVLDREIVADLVASPWASAIAVDSTAGRDEEAMKVTVDAEGRVTALGKWLPVADSGGEAIGVGKLAGADSSRLFAAIERLVHHQGRGNAYYEDVYHALLGEGWVLGSCDTTTRRWAEIDDERDLANAQALCAELPS